MAGLFWVMVGGGGFILDDGRWRGVILECGDGGGYTFGGGGWWWLYFE